MILSATLRSAPGLPAGINVPVLQVKIPTQQPAISRVLLRSWASHTQHLRRLLHNRGAGSPHLTDVETEAQNANCHWKGITRGTGQTLGGKALGQPASLPAPSGLPALQCGLPPVPTWPSFPPALAPLFMELLMWATRRASPLLTSQALPSLSGCSCPSLDHNALPTFSTK